MNKHADINKNTGLGIKDRPLFCRIESRKHLSAFISFGTVMFSCAAKKKIESQTVRNLVSLQRQNRKAMTSGRKNNRKQPSETKTLNICTTFREETMLHLLLQEKAMGERHLYNNTRTLGIYVGHSPAKMHAVLRVKRN